MKAYLWLLTLVMLLFIEPASAGTTTGLPWETPLETIKSSITGPVAMVISLLGVTVAGGMLIFGGELGEFTRRIVMLVLVIGLLVSATTILTLLYGSAGAVIGG
jgi:type IV secretion system protein VirB2